MSRTGRKQEQNQLVLGQDRELTEAELEALISQVEAEGMLRAPVGLKSRVMEKTRRMDVQMIVRTQELPKRLSDFCHSPRSGNARFEYFASYGDGMGWRSPEDVGGESGSKGSGSGGAGEQAGQEAV